MRLLSILAAAAVWAVSIPVSAQSPTYKLGRAPHAEEVGPWDIAISPDGKELPRGSGTAVQGAKVFAGRGCAWCHGPTGVEGPGPRLVADKDDPEDALRRLPFATTIWDYINRAMPRGQEGSLRADEVYALTALLLYNNGIIKENEVIDNATLPTVRMPNRDKFTEPDLSKWSPGMPMPRPFRVPRP
jgi:S-disulfanyl-L-cysteine oxidoreductase SoxD